MIAALAGQGHSAKKCAQMLGVAPSGFFYWRNRPPTMLELRTGQLSGLIADIHHASDGTYGTRRVTAELRLGYELTANRKAVARIMRSLGLQGLPILKAKRRGPASDGSAAGDLVLRQFTRDAPDRLAMLTFALTSSLGGRPGGPPHPSTITASTASICVS